MKFRGKTKKPQEAANSMKKFSGNGGTATTVQGEAQNTPAEGETNTAEVEFLWSGALWGCLSDLPHREKFKQSKENYFLPMLGWDVLSFIVLVLVIFVLCVCLYATMDEATVDVFLESRYSDFLLVLPLALLRMRFLGKKSAQLFNKCLRSIDGTGEELAAYTSSEKFEKREKSATRIGAVLWALSFIKS